MKICFMCDLHLPFDENALQYRVLDWAIADILKKTPDCIVFAGDVTCDGNLQVYSRFLDKISRIGIPFLYIPGNSDLRDCQSRLEIKNNASACRNEINGTVIFAVNDSDGSVSAEDFEKIQSADDNSIVFMHHPIDALEDVSRENMLDWKSKHCNTMLFYGHNHKSERDANSISLQAMDPDKSIGESPCITYCDTDSGELRKAYYFCPVPTDLYGYFGISCYKIRDDIEFAIDNKLKNLELRPNCLDADEAELCELIAKWRSAGGENLSIHLPDIAYADGRVIPPEAFEGYISLAKKIRADRFTQHVPVVSVSIVRTDKHALERIASYLAEQFNTIEHPVVIGVENMHMTSKDKPDDSRRFGYIPEECIEFMKAIASKCRHKVGINFDIGHARNNSPYSQKYQISTWFSMIGKYIVGYHIHQVTEDRGVFENHMPITHIYGRLISYGSLFASWLEGDINKAPVVFEMRPEGAYRTTLDTFDEYKNKRVFDIHSHTFYSDCGRDDPHDLINTAVRNGLSVLGISDHNYGIGSRKGEYLCKIRSLACEYKDKIKILCGIEIATLPHLYDIKNPDEIKEYDYCLIEHITNPDSIVGGNLIKFCKELKIPCGIAHTDMFAYCDMYGYDYEEFFGQMAEAGIFWEMNVSYDSIHRYREHEYVKEFMKDSRKADIVKKSGLCVSVGFDSHRFEDYDGFKVHEMYDFLKNNKIRIIDEF